MTDDTRPADGFEDFDRYCDAHDIQPGELGAAFGAWLHELTGWDGPMGKVERSNDE